MVMNNNQQMWIAKTWNNLSLSLSDAIARIFSPNRLEYPSVGVQPFEGEPYQPSQIEW